MPPIPSPSLFRERLILHRTKSELTQEQLANKAGVGRGKVYRWEKGGRGPTVAELLRLCEFFKVTPNYLTGYSDSPTGLWPDQFLANEDLIERMRADPAVEGVPLWKVPRRHRLVDIEEAARIQRELKLEH